MIVIRDQQLRLLVLAQLVRDLQRGAQEQAPPPPGFTPGQVEELKALSTAELVKLSEMTKPRVAAEIDADTLEHGRRPGNYLHKPSRQLEHLYPNGGAS